MYFTLAYTLLFKRANMRAVCVLSKVVLLLIRPPIKCAARVLRMRFT